MALVVGGVVVAVDEVALGDERAREGGVGLVEAGVEHAHAHAPAVGEAGERGRGRVHRGATLGELGAEQAIGEQRGDARHTRERFERGVGQGAHGDEVGQEAIAIGDARAERREERVDQGAIGAGAEAQEHAYAARAVGHEVDGARHEGRVGVRGGGRGRWGRRVAGVAGDEQGEQRQGGAGAPGRAMGTHGGHAIRLATNGRQRTRDVASAGEAAMLRRGWWTPTVRERR